MDRFGGSSAYYRGSLSLRVDSLPILIGVEVYESPGPARPRASSPYIG